MKIRSLTYTPKESWSAPFPAWDSPSTLVLVFAAPDFFENHEPLDQLAAAYPQSVLLGCSTCGEILQNHLQDNSLVVAVAAFEHASLSLAHLSVSSPDQSRQAGERLAEQLASPTLRHVFVLADWPNVNGTDLARGLNSKLGSSIGLTGGLAADGWNFQRTWVIGPDRHPCTSHAVALGLSGERLRIGHGCTGGWDLLGVERHVTRATGPTLYELDGSPALELYKKYIGERSQELPAAGMLFPLAIRFNTLSEKRLIRTVVSVDESHQSITFAGDVPEGCLARFMRTSLDRVIDGAGVAAEECLSAASPSSPALAIAITCAGRRMVLGPRTEEELYACLDVLPDGVCQVGFYSYGELAPYLSSRCDLHNQTMTMTLISEDER